jgi:hypothetical protein
MKGLMDRIDRSPLELPTRRRKFGRVAQVQEYGKWSGGGMGM